MPPLLESVHGCPTGHGDGFTGDVTRFVGRQEDIRWGEFRGLSWPAEWNRLAELLVMANHGKRAPLARMSRGDGVLIYSAKTGYPQGEPLRAITIVGEISGDQPEPSDVIDGGFRRAARLREITPLPLDQICEHLPASRIRFGFFDLTPGQAQAIWTLVEQHSA